LELFSVGFFVNLITPIESVSAREKFEFSYGDHVVVISDKAYRKTKENSFEAIGNVIISHSDSSIYGEKASLNFKSSQVNVVGNVRYVSPDTTIYGAKLNYNLKTKYFNLDEARIISGNYVVLGKKIEKFPDGTIHALDAEYTTCRDCPESWSVQGEKVVITSDGYVKIKNAYVKVYGVVTFYIPYLVVPVKNGRETGLLFPSLSLNLDEGVRFGLPWFWAINDSSDMTLTPTVLGKRGVGNELQYRQFLGEKTWFELNSLQALDRIYAPDKIDTVSTGSSSFRHITNYEHHSSLGHHFNHHVNYTFVNDLDSYGDYTFFSENKSKGSEIGGDSFFEVRSDIAHFTAESYFNRNQLFANGKGFDHRYVQILPKLSFDITPFNIFRTDYFFLRSLTMGFETDYTVFKQNHLEEAKYIRNANRFNSKPYLDWHFGSLGPVNMGTKIQFDYQHYTFPYQSQKYFSKSGLSYESEISVEFEKVYGLSYRYSLPVESVKMDSRQEENDVDKTVKDKYRLNGLVGNIPLVDEKLKNRHVSIRKNSYKHSQEVKIKHYLLTEDKYKGSQKFEEQIRQEEGQFDVDDAFDSERFLFDTSTPTSQLPKTNTLELQWNNEIIKKDSNGKNPLEDGLSLRDHYSYSKIGHFKVSQGYRLDSNESDLEDRLTRLSVDLYGVAGRTSILINENYFYSTQNHQLSMDLSFAYDHYLTLGTSYRYNSFVNPVNKNVSFNGSYNISDLVELRTEQEYDFGDDQFDRRLYGVRYMPLNKCWTVEFAHSRSRIKKNYSVNFAILFNENNQKMLGN